jgi:BirA family biotin operon repressor/biotin-[acetyl-CoA-carboxylase] ligase|tara:strand:+ start:2639 stop:3655 length:1017 start_codon:yes stop_codon:yes gene_type:complete
MLFTVFLITLTPLTFPVLSFLSDGKFHSGEIMAKNFNVSRVAIWHAIAGAEKLGIEVFSVRGKGYRLTQSLDLLEEKRVKLAIGEMANLFNITVLDVVDSTNNYLKKVATNGHPHASCVAANIQTHGKGRRGRQWQSALGENLTFSFLWRFTKGAAALSGLSLVVGVALIRSLKKLNVHQALLKWPNDILIQDDGVYKKLAGILIELQGDMDGQSAAIIGVGININLSKKQVAKIDQPAVSMKQCIDESIDPNNFLAIIIKDLAEVLAIFQDTGFAFLKDEWLSYDAFQDKVINVTSGDGNTTQGRSKGVNDAGSLEVITDDGLKVYASGEISIRSAD